MRVDAAGTLRHIASVPAVSALATVLPGSCLNWGQGRNPQAVRGRPALPASQQLTLSLLRSQHQEDEADKVHLELGAAIADKHQQADVIAEHNSCSEHGLLPSVPGTSHPAPLPFETLYLNGAFSPGP